MPPLSRSADGRQRAVMSRITLHIDEAAQLLARPYPHGLGYVTTLRRVAERLQTLGYDTDARALSDLADLLASRAEREGGGQ